MRKSFIISLFFAFIAIMAISSCGSKSSKGVAASAEDHPSTLVLYYSNTGSTRQVAEEIHNLVPSDICEILPAEAYPQDYAATIERWKKENERNENPPIMSLPSNIAEYDTIFLGFPIWGGTYANPIKTLVENNKFEGKTIITFATFGSGGLVSATEDLRNALPKADVVKGFGIRNARIDKMPKELSRFLKEKGFVEGKIIPYPVYSAPQPVTEKENAIFEAACGDYQFPLGTPVSFGKRTTPETTDYKFIVSSTAHDGSSREGTVYVSVPNDENLRPEFTLAER